MNPRKAVGIQYAALPYRIEGGKVRVLLITSRQTRRWVIPKGWPMGGLAPQEAAAIEAAEEAGLTGQIEPAPLGSYAYLKQRKREAAAVQVIVFAFRVQAQAEAFKEQDQRTLRWFDARAAARRVAEPGLQRLIRDFAAARAPSLMARSLRRYLAWRFGTVGR